MGNTYPSFSLNERCYELIQNTVEDILEKKEKPIRIMGVSDTRLLIEMVKEQSPLFKNDTKFIMEYIEDIAGIKVKEEEIIETDEEKETLTYTYRPLKGTIEIKPGLVYERKTNNGWITEKFPSNWNVDWKSTANNRNYQWWFNHIHNLYLKNEIRVKFQYNFKIGDKVNHILDKSIKGNIKHRLPQGFNWNPNIDHDINKYHENSYLISWENNSNIVPLRNWYNESELLKLEAMPMKTNKRIKKPKNFKKISLPDVKPELTVEQNALRKKHLIPNKVKRPTTTIFQVKIHKGCCDENKPCAHFHYVQTARHGSIFKSIDDAIKLNHPIVCNEYGLDKNKYKLIIMTSQPQQTTVVKETKPYKKPKQVRKPKEYTIHTPEQVKLVCVKDTLTDKVERMSKTKAKKLVHTIGSTHVYVDKTEWRNFLKQEKEDREASKPGLRTNVVNESVGHCINRSTRKRIQVESTKKTKEGSKLHQKTQIPVQLERNTIEQIVNVPVIKEFFKRMYFWKTNEEGVRVVDWSRAPYVRIIKRLVGVKSETKEIVLSERMASKTIYSLKDNDCKHPVTTKEQKAVRSIKDTQTYLEKKNLMSPKELEKEFSSLNVSKKQGSPGVGSWIGKLEEIREKIRKGVSDSIILSDLKEAFNGHSNEKSINFLRLLKLTRKKKDVVKDKKKFKVKIKKVLNKYHYPKKPYTPPEE